MIGNDAIPLYQRGFVSSMVSALKNVSKERNDELQNSVHHGLDRPPAHLFTAEKVTLSRITAPNDYDLLAEFSFARNIGNFKQ